MSYRFMRVIVFFDLPVVTASNRRNYRKFRGLLLKLGFIMMQESVYTKMIPTMSSYDSVISSIRKGKPPEGLIEVLCITEKQFQKIEYIIGEYKTDVIDSDERMIIL